MTESQAPHVISIGWAQGKVSLIETILRKVEENSNITFSHFVSADIFHEMEAIEYYDGKIFKFPEEKDVKTAVLDLPYLADLEKGSSFTLNNLILSDRVLSHMPHVVALRYCCLVAKRIHEVITEIRPTYILGSWDSVIPGLTSMIAKKENIPFYTTKFSVIPDKEVAFCEYPFQDREFPLVKIDEETLKERAERYLNQWLNKSISAPAYVSVGSRLEILKRLPFYVQALTYRMLTSLKYGKNKYTTYSTSWNIKQFLRKKGNLILRRNSFFVKEAPNTPFFFYGLHMQPESSIDVWAPFYADQYKVIEAISRAMPVGFSLCVKIHISDADNYSNNDLKRLLRIPGVKIVSPNVGSRDFIEKAKMLFAIQGTIGLEGALLGKPVVMFGESAVVKFSSAAKVKALEELPALVAKMMKQEPPSKEEIVTDYAHFLRNYLPASSDDWVAVVENGLTEQEIKNYISIFTRLVSFSN